MREKRYHFAGKRYHFGIKGIIISDLGYLKVTFIEQKGTYFRIMTELLDKNERYTLFKVKKDSQLEDLEVHFLREKRYHFR